MNTLTDNTKIEICRSDFYLTLQNAMTQAGGNPKIDDLKRMSLCEVVNMIAQNGIRVVYLPDRHMDAVGVVWNSAKKSNVEVDGESSGGGAGGTGGVGSSWPSPVVYYGTATVDKVRKNAETFRAPTPSLGKKQLLCDVHEPKEDVIPGPDDVGYL